MKTIFFFLAFAVVLHSQTEYTNHFMQDDSSSFFDEKNEDSSSNIAKDLISDTKTFLIKGMDYFTYPFELKSDQLILAAGISISLYGLMYTDNFIKKTIGRETIATLNDDFWDIPTSYGIASYANILSLSTYTVGLVFRDNWLRTTGRMMFESLSYSGIAVITLRYIFARNRPYSEKGANSFNWFLWNNELQSFPSGHTTVAFALSTILAERINTYYSRIFFYGMASLTAYARVLNNQHWFSDVVAGALLGIGTGFFVVSKESGDEDHLLQGITLIPNNRGLTLFYSF